MANLLRFGQDRLDLSGPGSHVGRSRPAGYVIALSNLLESAVRFGSLVIPAVDDGHRQRASSNTNPVGNAAIEDRPRMFFVMLFACSCRQPRVQFFQDRRQPVAEQFDTPCPARRSG